MCAQSQTGALRARSLAELAEEISVCRACPRLVEWREFVAREKKRCYTDHEYWGRPVPGFGDPNARLMIVGLAPGAHGANRTGRLFTGDSSGDWLFQSLFDAGFANQPQSVHRDDGLKLSNAFITAAGRCAPPDNKPQPDELMNCTPYLDRELELFWSRLRCVVVLGGLANGAVYSAFLRRGIAKPHRRPGFAHLAEWSMPGTPTVLCSYHPSRQNTNTRRLTREMFLDVWLRARAIVGP